MLECVLVWEVGSVLCQIDSAHLVQPKKEASKKYVESSPSIKKRMEFAWFVQFVQLRWQMSSASGQ